MSLRTDDRKVIKMRKRDRELSVSPREYLREQTRTMESPRGRLVVVSCRSGTRLARDVVREYDESLLAAGETGRVVHLEDVHFRFSDGETCVRLDADVSGHDAFLFQALSDPVSGRSVDENYLAFLIAVRALRECGFAS